MPKNDNPHSIRLVESLRKNAGESFAEDFAEEYPLSKSADADKKFVWAQNVCAYLEDNFGEDKITDIRRDCRCFDGTSGAKRFSKYLKKADSIKAFVDAYNEKETDSKLEYVSENSVRVCYPTCYCSCVKRVPQELSKTWCLCTVGYTEGVFNLLFEKKVDVKLIESIKTGGDRCVIEVKW